jgi:hypothetical protein
VRRGAAVAPGSRQAFTATVAIERRRPRLFRSNKSRAQEAEWPRGARARTWPLRHWLRCSTPRASALRAGRRGALRRVAGAMSLPELWPYRPRASRSRSLVRSCTSLCRRGRRAAPSRATAGTGYGRARRRNTGHRVSPAPRRAPVLNFPRDGDRAASTPCVFRVTGHGRARGRLTCVNQ